MNTEQIIFKKQIGDIKQVAEIIGESYANTCKLIQRTNAKRHPEVIAVLAKIIEARELAKKEVSREYLNQIPIR